MWRQNQPQPGVLTMLTANKEKSHLHTYFGHLPTLSARIRTWLRYFVGKQMYHPRSPKQHQMLSNPAPATWTRPSNTIARSAGCKDLRFLGSLYSLNFPHFLWVQSEMAQMAPQKNLHVQITGLRRCQYISGVILHQEHQCFKGRNTPKKSVLAVSSHPNFESSINA